jgi:hypothetical protein
VREHNSTRVEREKPLHPGWDGGEIGGGDAPEGSMSEHVGAKLASEIRCLTGANDRAIIAAHDERLMSGRVTGSRDEPDAGSDLGISLDLLVDGSVELNRRRNGVVGLPSVLELGPLYKDRPSGKAVVSAAVIEMQMAVDDPGHSRHIDSDLRHGVRDVAALWTVVRFCLGIDAEARIEQDGSGRCGDDVAEHGLDAGAAGRRLARRTDEVPVAHTADVVLAHRSSDLIARPAIIADARGSACAGFSARTSSRPESPVSGSMMSSRGSVRVRDRGDHLLRFRGRPLRMERGPPPRGPPCEYAWGETFEALVARIVADCAAARSGS